MVGIETDEINYREKRLKRGHRLCLYPHFSR